MRLGLVTDIHNHHRELKVALELLQIRGVDRIITIGDTCDAYGETSGAKEVAKLLVDHAVTGVWGNHDFTLCHEVTEGVRERYPALVLSAMSRMQPRLILEDCHFSHKDAAVDPFDILQLWDFSGDPPNLMEKAERGFAATPCRLQFVGHYHRWWAATTEGPLDWSGEKVLQFAPEQRYFVVVAPVFQGWCALLDIDAGELEPISCQPETDAVNG